MTTTVTPVEKLSFAYRAQTHDGQTIAGTIEAADLEDATRQLRSMNLRVLDISPADRMRLRAACLSGEDFLAFNQQLAMLTQAGLPVEHGLRLIAQDMRRGRLATTVNRLADELNRGTPLPQAFEKFKHQFPPLYARLIDAGIRSNNLSGMLLNLGRHVEMVQHLRASLWRASAYPLMIMLALIAILIVLSLFVLPQIASMYENYRSHGVLMAPRGRWGAPVSPQLPWITTALIQAGEVLPIVLFVIGGAIVVLPFIWMILRRFGWDRAVGDALLLPLPLIGPVLKRNLIARWTDALRIGTGAGMDLPAAIDVAAHAVGSPKLRHDSFLLTQAVESGQPLTSVEPLKLLPPAVPAAIEVGSRNQDLPTTLETLSRMYQQQAEMRLRILPMLLTPILLLVVAGSIGFVMAALLLPIFRMTQYIAW